MLRQQIWDNLQEIVRIQVGNPAVTLGEGTVVANVPGWDSFAHASIIVAVEESFGVYFDRHELAAIDSISGLVDTIELKVA